MYDDPSKGMQKLEDQLIAAEINQKPALLNDEQFEELYGRILEEFGPREESDGAPVSEPPIRNFANHYGNAAPQRPLPGSDEPAPPEKNSRGLVFLVCLEVLAIAVLAAYWLRGLL